DDDFLVSLYELNTVDHILVFTNTGKYLYIPAHKVEEFKWKDAGKHISYLVKLEAHEKIIGSILVKDFDLPLYVMLATKNGQIKRTNLAEFKVTRYSKAMKCMGLKGNDEVVNVSLTDGNQGVLLTTKVGYGALYSETEVSIVGVKASGIKAINLRNDEVISLNTFNPMTSNALMIISENGGVKRLKVEDIAPCNRATKGNLLFKNPKSKAIYVKDSVICSVQDTLSLICSSLKVLEIAVKDYSNASLDQKPSPIKELQNENLLYVNYDFKLSTDIYKNVEQNREPITLQQAEEPTLLDDLEIEEVPKQEKKETPKKIEKKEAVHYEKLTLEDILNEDDF
ncbi:MAG: DNA gyrase C-terminal beta-propeller domain-containing protein, partial [Coprobacillaceae bacterium]